MKHDFIEAAKNLTDAEIRVALANLLEHASEPEAGIIRQLLGPEKKPLSEAQMNVYNKHILGALVEKCGNQSCKNFTLAGVDYCPTCEIEFG